jgi:putative solute:sodium symporter small subunit
MQTAEVVAGLLVIALAVALALGAAAFFTPVPPAGLGLTIALSGLGSSIATHGMAGRARQYANSQAARTWQSVFYAVFAITTVAALPLVVDVLDLITVAGFPLGYYMAAQGVLIGLAALGFRAAMHLDKLEDRAVSPSSAEGD